jgi:hypothetical protein
MKRHLQALSAKPHRRRHAQAILEVAVEAAKSGDMRAVELILSRAWPARKGSPVSLALPPILTGADLPPALAAVVTAVASGHLTPDEGQAMATILETHRRGIELANFERRLDALEALASEGERAAGRMVLVRSHAERIVVLFNDEMVADHPRQFRRDQIIYDPWHYLPVLVRKPLRANRSVNSRAICSPRPPMRSPNALTPAPNVGTLAVLHVLC